MMKGMLLNHQSQQHSWVHADVLSLGNCKLSTQGLGCTVNVTTMIFMHRFAHMIGTREHADHLWRITKDVNQHSHISQEDLLE